MSKIRYELYHAAFEKEPVHVATLNLEIGLSYSISNEDNTFLLERLFNKTQNDNPEFQFEGGWVENKDFNLEQVGEGPRRSTSVGDFALRITPSSTSRWGCVGAGWRKGESR